jgi:hypothetical protein
MAMPPITLEQRPGAWIVRMGDRYSVHSTWAEFVGQVLSLTNPGPSEPLVVLRTQAEHDRRRMVRSSIA